MKVESNHRWRHRPDLVSTDKRELYTDECSMEKRLQLTHVAQLYSWDCGLASAQMVLKYYEKDLSHFKEVCDSLGFGHSVWTIDLARLMTVYGVPHTFCTITLGVLKGYSNKRFYRSSFNVDETRVTRLFDQAQALGINVHERSLQTKDLLQHLSTDNPVLVLVDWCYLLCKWCRSKLKCCFPLVGKCLDEYQGHYIVVCGYNKKTKLIYYKNPSCHEDLCCCSWKSFDTARKRYGTDEDVLLLYKDTLNHRKIKPI
ncbi:Protein GUCD1 [Lamellibrachia satsuma]|nr:Protein GUCD1 [Lamellibrachia satsuma]